jgi:hypothetical protein
MSRKKKRIEQEVVEEVLDKEDTNDYIEEVIEIVKAKPAPIHDEPIAKKLKLPNRPIY